MKKIHKLTIGPLITTLLLAMVFCCCAPAFALADTAVLSCHPERTLVFSDRLESSSHNGSCNCQEITASLPTQVFDFKNFGFSLLQDLSSSFVTETAYRSSCYSTLNLSNRLELPSQNSSIPLYLKDSVLRI